METISREIITKVKDTNNIVEVVRESGIALTKNGKNYKGLCPFHHETEPSFNVNETKQVFNCFGCNAGGDIIKFVMEIKKTDFREAVNYLMKRAGIKMKGEKRKMKNGEKQNLLNRVVEYYHKKILQNKKAQDYLFNKRGIKNKKLIKIYKIGFCDGSLIKTLKNQPEYKKQLKEIGVITNRGIEAFKNCVIFPIFNEKNNCVNIYARRIIKSKVEHLYLPGENTGIFNWQAAKQNQSIILTESIIDCLSFIDNGITNAIPIYGTEGFTLEHTILIKYYKIKNLYFALDNDKAGKEATNKHIKVLSNFPGLNIYKIKMDGCKDVNEYYQKYSSLISLIENPEPIVINEKPKSLQVEYINHTITFNIEDRIYRVKGFTSTNNSTQLKVNLKAMYEDNFYIDNIDLYSARIREVFKNGCSEELDIDKEIINSDLKIIIQKLEDYREKEKGTNDEEKKYIMSPVEESEALEFLKNKKLIDKILKDFETLGYIGEETNKLVGYLAAVSRKLDEPLAVLIMSRSAAGKSSLLDVILKLIPARDFIKYTAVTGQALFYKGENSLVHKILAIAEEEGAQRASYSLKTIQSDKVLNIAATGKDPATGKLKTYDYKVNGPIALFITTTSAEIDYETLNRFIILTIDECLKQTELIHNQQRNEETLEGMINKLKTEKIMRKHQNAQRLLKPLRVFNPYAKYLTFVSDRLRARRDHKKYLGLIKAIAFLHQHQRVIKKIEFDNQIIDYIEVTLSDIELANRLVTKVLIRTLDELAPPSRTLLKLIQQMVKKKRVELVKKNKSKAALKKSKTIFFTRWDIRDFTKWSDFQIKVHIKQLEHLEYLNIISGSNGKKYVYELAYEGSHHSNEPSIHLISKKEILELIKKEKSKTGRAKK